MSVGLHSLQAPKRRATKRVGRGNSSGRGAYSSRGIKGQRARAGGRTGLHSRSLKAFYQSVPKTKGFTTRAHPVRGINLSELDRYFSGKAEITIKDFYAQGLLSQTVRRIKILGNGTVKRAMKISAHAVSASAKAAIEKAGGTIHIVIEQKKSEKQPADDKS